MDENACAILVIEDNPVDLDLMLRAIKINGILNPIQIARNGEEVAELMVSWESSGKAPGLIILDLKLPRLDGFSVLLKIKLNHKLKTIPIVVLTTSHDESDIKKSYEIGANSYLVKPVAFEQFVELVKLVNLYWLQLNKVPSNL